MEPDGRRWLLGRRRVSDPTEVTASVVVAPQATPLEALGRVAGRRWTIARGFEAATGDVGLDEDEVRRWTGWSRQMTLALWAYARLAVRRAGAIAVEAFNNSLPGPPPGRRLTAFTAGHGLASRGASRRFADASGAWSWPCRRRRTPSWPGLTGGAGIRLAPHMITTSGVAQRLTHGPRHH